MKTPVTCFDMVKAGNQSITRLEAAIYQPFFYYDLRSPTSYLADGTECPLTVDPEQWRLAREGDACAMRAVNVQCPGCIYENPTTRDIIKQKTWRAALSADSTQARRALKWLQHALLPRATRSRRRLHADAPDTRRRRASRAVESCPRPPIDAGKRCFFMLLRDTFLIRALYKKRRYAPEQISRQAFVFRILPQLQELGGKTATGVDRAPWRDLLLVGRLVTQDETRDISELDAAFQILADIMGYKPDMIREHVMYRSGRRGKKSPTWARDVRDATASGRHIASRLTS